ncbi:MAG TPA: DUF1810 domain-containing protein [Phenylobacterium sp.]|nr:DUF1810 domain-containing protein [Phenylobacterium sp.]
MPDLARFLEAQDAPAGGGSVYDRALAELRAGRKQTHWMWFVLPQIQGLGSSPMAQRYAIADLAEARAYLAHPVLGARLRACVAALNAVEGRTAHEIMGNPDDLKLRSCLTLFARATADNADFRAALDRYYAGVEDAATVERLGG